MPEISLIVPVYRVEKYIKQCIDSIRAQTFRDIEIILVDDGSPDDCGRICDEYEKKDPRIRVVHQANGGLSAARNTGIRHASGRFITFVDSDDCIAPRFCEKLYSVASEYDCDFVSCSFLKFDDKTAPEACESTDSAPVVLTNTEYLKKQMKEGMGAWAKLYRRQVFDDLSFERGRLHEDVILAADLVRTLHNNVCVIGDKLYFYRQNDEGIMAKSREKCSPDRIYAGKYLFDTVKRTYPEIKEETFRYAVQYPWYFVDRIYVRRDFKSNRKFLLDFQRFLKDNKREIKSAPELSEIVKKRMRLFADSRFLYGFNAYARLFRVYLYRIFGKDAYKDGHGI